LSSVTNVVGRRGRPAEVIGHRGPRPGTTGAGRRCQSAAEVETPPLHGVLDLADELFEHVLEEEQTQHLRLRIDDPGHMAYYVLPQAQTLLDFVIGGDG